MHIEELIDLCKERISCEGCPAKKACMKFKEIQKTITEPWELTRLQDAVFPQKEEG